MQSLLKILVFALLFHMGCNCTVFGQFKDYSLGNPDSKYAGVISSMAIDPNNPRSIYIGTYYGAILHTQDECASWDTLSTPCRLVQSVIVNPHNSNNILIFSKEKSSGFWSDDGGKNWNSMTFPKNIDTNVVSGVYVLNESCRFSSIENVVYCAVTIVCGPTYAKAVFCKSTDGGKSWDLLTVFDEDVFPNPCSLCLLNDSTFVLGGYGGAIMRSTNAGVEWVKVRSLSTHPYVNKQQVSNITFSRSHPEHGYCSMLNAHGMTNGGIYESNDSGQSWHEYAFADTSILAFGYQEVRENSVLFLGGYHSENDHPFIYYPLMALKDRRCKTWNNLTNECPWHCNGSYNAVSVKGVVRSDSNSVMFYIVTECGLLSYTYDFRSVDVSENKTSIKGTDNIGQLNTRCLLNYLYDNTKYMVRAYDSVGKQVDFTESQIRTSLESYSLLFVVVTEIQSGTEQVYKYVAY